MKHLLCAVPIFAGLNDRALEIFLERAQSLCFSPGELIVREGEANRSMFIIESGGVSIIKNYGAAHPVALVTLGPGQFFGEMCILETLPRIATGLAISQTTVVRVDSMDFYHLYQKLPDQYSILVLNIARDLSRRLRHLDEVYAHGS